MLRTAARWGMVAVALVIVGPIAGALMRPIPAPDGGGGGTALVSAAPIAGVLRTLVVLALAGGWAALTSRIVGARPAYLAAGIITAFAAWTAAPTSDLILLTRDPSILTRLAIEGFLVVLLGAAIFMLIARLDRRGAAAQPDDAGDSSVGMTGLGLVAGLACGGFAAWFLAQDGLAGQALAAAALASILLATVARVIAHRRATPLLVAGIALLAGAGPVLATTLQGNELVALAYEGRLFPLARIGPLHWLAGAFIGVPIGLSWAESMLERHHP